MNSMLQVIIQRLKKELVVLYGDSLVELNLFGSYARGDQEVESDIDILVVLQSMTNPGEEIKRTGKIIAALSLDYDVVISCIFMSQADYQNWNTILLHNIRKEGVLL